MENIGQRFLTKSKFNRITPVSKVPIIALKGSENGEISRTKDKVGKSASEKSCQEKFRESSL